MNLWWYLGLRKCRWARPWKDQWSLKHSTLWCECVDYGRLDKKLDPTRLHDHRNTFWLDDSSLISFSLGKNISINSGICINIDDPFFSFTQKCWISYTFWKGIIRILFIYLFKFILFFFVSPQIICASLKSLSFITTHNQFCSGQPYLHNIVNIPVQR